MILTIDVGGTKTLVAVFTEDGKIENQVKFPTPKDYLQFINELTTNITSILDGQKPTACAIAMPGRIDRENGVVVAFGNLPWKNVPIREELAKILDCPIFVENDANLAGLAEATSVLDTYRKTVYITVSTGIGGIYVIDGKMDKNTLDAEVGHTLHEHDGKLQRWEEFASGSAIVRKTGKRASDITDASDWYMVARNIAIGLIDVIATLTPECIIIGGGVGTHLDKFEEKLISELELYKDDLIKLPKILKAAHPEEAVIYGGYLLVKQQLK